MVCFKFKTLKMRIAYSETKLAYAMAYLFGVDRLQELQRLVLDPDLSVDALEDGGQGDDGVCAAALGGFVVLVGEVVAVLHRAGAPAAGRCGCRTVALQLVLRDLDRTNNMMKSQFKDKNNSV